MTLEAFSPGGWIGRLAVALPRLAEAQAPYLEDYWEWNPRPDVLLGVADRTGPAFPLAQVRALYGQARNAHVFGEADRYAPLRAALDPVRDILISHPTLARVVGPIAGGNSFYMQILNCGGSTSPTGLIAGVMARAAELSGDRFRGAAGELNAFLAPVVGGGSPAMADGLDIGYDAALFHGLSVKERIEVADGMVLLPFEQVRAFVDEDLIEAFAPPGAGFHRWRSVGALASTYRWRPAFWLCGR